MRQTWLGCTVNRATISITQSDTVGLSANIISQRPVETAGAPTPVFSAPAAFQGADSSFFFLGGRDLRFEDFNVTIDNSIEVKHALNGRRWCMGHIARGFSIGGSFTLEFETEAERRRMWGAATATGPKKVMSPIHLSANLAHPEEIAAGHNYFLKLDIPEIYIESAPAGVRRLRDRILQTVNFRPVYSAAHDKYADLTIRNSTAQYPDPA
jgi:hypothetical protein